MGSPTLPKMRRLSRLYFFTGPSPSRIKALDDRHRTLGEHKSTEHPRLVSATVRVPDRGGGSVELGDLVLLNDGPEPTGVGPRGDALEEDRGGTIAERSVHDVAVACGEVIGEWKIERIPAHRATIKRINIKK
jgi:hypothetical protein